MNCVCTTKAAEMLGISSRRLRHLLQQERVKGAYKSGKFWLIPLYEGMPIVIAAERGQKGTWKVVEEPERVTININSNNIRQNIKKRPEERKPTIAVRQRSKQRYVHQLEIPVPCRLVYDSDRPLKCGARVWIEILGFSLDEIAC